MKFFLLSLITVMSSSVFAQLNLDFRVVGSSFELDFHNGYVCSVDPAFSKAPTLGYGISSRLATENAINNCIMETGNHQMHCSRVKCERISFSRSTSYPRVSVVSNNGHLSVNFSTGSNVQCSARSSFGRGYFSAQAPTQLEAEVYAQRLCMDQTGNARMHCDALTCSSLAPVRVQFRSTTRSRAERRANRRNR
jgi:hypothetical protein